MAEILSKLGRHCRKSDEKELLLVTPFNVNNTSYLPNGKEKLMIDCTLIDSKDTKVVKDFRVKRSYQIGSQHFLLVITLKKRVARAQVIRENTEQKLVINIEKLNFDSVKKAEILMQFNTK